MRPMARSPRTRNERQSGEGEMVVVVVANSPARGMRRDDGAHVLQHKMSWRWPLHATRSLSEK